MDGIDCGVRPLLREWLDIASGSLGFALKAS
jgi:hypothetical protein